MSQIHDNTLKLATTLMKAVNDEWLAHFQYWVGSIMVTGPLDEWAIEEFAQHSLDEYDHATTISAWLWESGCGGIPTEMADILRVGSQYCGYVYPSGKSTESFLRDNIKAEGCAIKFYEGVMDFITDHPYNGPDVSQMIASILKKEVEHKNDLEEIQENLVKDGRKQW